MLLEKLHYVQHRYSPFYWEVTASFALITLLVGRNSAGKTRALNVISSLAASISNKRKPSDGTWIATFSDAGRAFQYSLEVEHSAIIKEQLTVDGFERLCRDSNGEGYSIDDTGEKIDFKIPESSLAVYSRRELKRSTFLEPLQQWADGFALYDFGGEMGRLTVGIVDESGADPSPTDPSQIIGVLRKGLRRWQDFGDQVRADMNRIGYDLETVGVDHSSTLIPQGYAPGPLLNVFVKERDLIGQTWQLPDMSRGMFRALSLLALVEYSVRSKSVGLMLIDDIGEGIDRTRAAKLIDIVLERSKEMRAQIIMTSNDRSTVNAVPLESICGLRRSGHVVSGTSVREQPVIFNQLADAGIANADLIMADLLER